jgi:monoamine oxidase
MTQMEQLYPGYLAELKKHQLIDWPKQPFIMSGYAVPAPGQVTTVVKNLNGSFEDRIFFAGEQTSPGFFGYMEGALQSGVLAASRVAISSTRKMPFRIRSAPPPAGQSKPSRSTAGARR